LVIVDAGFTQTYWSYNFIGTRLASHGFVVAALEHTNEWAWPWSNGDDFMVTTFNRVPDDSFAITELLQKNRDRRELLHGVIDASKIAAGGHSLGGYSAYALAGGDDEVCDSLIISSPPEPQYTCASARRDHRIGAIIALDGMSGALRFNELQRISVPSLIMGQTVEYAAAQWGEDSASVNARAHAAIDRGDSYRVDIKGANHFGYTGFCDGLRVMDSMGLDLTEVFWQDLASWEASWPCSSYAGSDSFNPETLASADAQQIVTKYMVAFLDKYFRRTSASILTSGYASKHQPEVEFFDSEECRMTLPSSAYYTYRPHPHECAAVEKDPSSFFAP